MAFFYTLWRFLWLAGAGEDHPLLFVKKESIDNQYICIYFITG